MPRKARKGHLSLDPEGPAHSCDGMSQTDATKTPHRHSTIAFCLLFHVLDLLHSFLAVTAETQLVFVAPQHRRSCLHRGFRQDVVKVDDLAQEHCDAVEMYGLSHACSRPWSPTIMMNVRCFSLTPFSSKVLTRLSTCRNHLARNALVHFHSHNDLLLHRPAKATSAFSTMDGAFGYRVPPAGTLF